MSVLAYPLTNEEEIFRNCTKKCGIITSTDDQQYFALGCMLCTEKFLYFDAFITHIQTAHLNKFPTTKYDFENASSDNTEDLTDSSLLVPQLEIKQEPAHCEDVGDDDRLLNDNDLLQPSVFGNVSEANDELGLSMNSDEQMSFMNDVFGSYDDAQLSNDYNDDEDLSQDNDSNSFNNGDDADDGCEVNYDDLVEESLISSNSSNGLVMHIKDRKMIQFLIDQYRRNVFLWNQTHPQFRDRAKRAQFLTWIVAEFKRRFNVSLARDAVTRKWDNLRTVYKRECNRMALENSNISTLWYFNELQFLSRLYKKNMPPSEGAVIKDVIHRRRITALWNDQSTNKLLKLVQRHPCFYDKFDPFYRSKEKRGEALQQIAAELSNMIDVTSIQISKRISQLRFDYSKQKQERLQCEANNLPFMPSYSYYEQMFFMDIDIAPFKCDYCSEVIQTTRDMEMHTLQHTQETQVFCKICQMALPNAEQLQRHMQTHHAAANNVPKEVKYHCDLCTAKFREKSNYDEHMRRHNDELLLPALAPLSHFSDMESNYSENAKTAYQCEVCDRSFAKIEQLTAHSLTHEQHEYDNAQRYKCEYPQCGKSFNARQAMLEHVRMHYSGDEEYNCDVCGKSFRSVKNLQNHKQIHDTVKRYVCKICGAAFSQAAGLYLHKRRHNRQDLRNAPY